MKDTHYLSFRVLPDSPVPDSGHLTLKWGRDNAVLEDFGLRRRPNAKEIAAMRGLELRES